MSEIDDFFQKETHKRGQRRKCGARGCPKPAEVYLIARLFDRRKYEELQQKKGSLKGKNKTRSRSFCFEHGVELYRQFVEAINDA